MRVRQDIDVVEFSNKRRLNLTIAENEHAYPPTAREVRKDMEKKTLPKFGELEMVKGVIPCWDPPPPDLYKVLDKAQLSKVVQLQIDQRIRLLRSRLTFYQKLSKILG